MSSSGKKKPKSCPVALNTSGERRKALEDKEAERAKQEASDRVILLMF